MIYLTESFLLSSQNNKVLHMHVNVVDRFDELSIKRDIDQNSNGIALKGFVRWL